MIRKTDLIAQIYVEIERARLTRKLAQLKEEEGNVAEAADVLQEVAVVSLRVVSAYLFSNPARMHRLRGSVSVLLVVLHQATKQGLPSLTVTPSAW